jgi:hypothetical protein
MQFKKRDIPHLKLLPTKNVKEQEAGGRKQEAGSRKQEAGSRKQEA